MCTITECGLAWRFFTRTETSCQLCINDYICVVFDWINYFIIFGFLRNVFPSSRFEWWAYTTHIVCPVYLSPRNFRSCIRYWCQHSKSPDSVHTTNNRSRNSVVSIVIRLRPGRSGVQIPGSWKKYFSSPAHRDRPWSPPTLLFIGSSSFCSSSYDWTIPSSIASSPDSDPVFPFLFSSILSYP
jgi:hypothetical protein